MTAGDSFRQWASGPPGRVGLAAPPRPCRRGLLAAPLALAWALTAAHAAASSGPAPCVGPEVEADGHVGPRWAAAVGSLRGALRALSDIDTCGKIAIFSAGEHVVVQVTLRDGRSTARRVEGPDELVATVGSLMLLPPATTQGAAAPSAPASSGSAAPAQASSSPPSAGTPPGAGGPPPAARRLSLEVGAGLAVRLTGSPNYVGPGGAAHAQLVGESWLLGAGFRGSAVEVLLHDNPKGYDVQAAAISVFVGRRATLGPVSLDAAAGPELLFEGQDFDPGGQEGRYEATHDYRVVGLMRVQRAASRVGPFGQLDADLSPRRSLGHHRHPDRSLPELSAWSVGVSLGVTGALF
jgi:hypothetical protein